MSNRYVEAAEAYSRAVMAGEIPVCKWTRLAVERQLADLAREPGPDWPWVFSAEAAERPCAFIELLPHIKGKWARERRLIELELWQCWILTTVFGWVHRETGLRRYREGYVEVPRKNAKALALDTPVPTPSGWTTMGELKAGDYVLGINGESTEVLGTSEVFTDHDCYRLTFSNGETVVADAGHLWVTKARVDQPGRRTRKGMTHGSSVMTRARTTEEIYATLTFGTRGDRNHTLAMPEALDGELVQLPIAPYTLGAWLGDGHSAGARLTGHVEDAELADYIRADGYPVITTPRANRPSILCHSLTDGVRGGGAGKSNCFQAQLRRMGLLKNKHIPAVYLRASLSQRLALLQGLMDTDGTISKTGMVISFTTTLEALADGMCELLATFGLKFMRHASPMMCCGRAVPGVAYRVQFMAFADELPVFRLQRKLKRMRLRPDGRNARSRTVQIVSCERVPSVPTRCISVAADDKQFRFGRTMLPTHNSTLSSGLGLFMLAADGEHGAEVYSAATTRDQARIVFDDARAMAERTPDLRTWLGVAIMQHSLTVAHTASKFTPLAAEGSTLDGLNVHFAVIDELHAHKTRAVYDVIDTARGAREQSLLWNITTAGTDRSGICYERRTHVTKLLDGVIEDPAMFGVIYTIDDGDDPFQPTSWAKANPNWNKSVLPDDMQAAARKAEAMPSALSNFLTKRLNVWVSGESPWMDMRAWERCADTSLRDLSTYAGQGIKVWAGLDLAQKKDFAALVVVFEHEFERSVGTVFDPTKRADDSAHYQRQRVVDRKWSVHTRLYLNELAIQESGNAHLSGWARQGYVTVTDGDITDFDVVADDMRQLCRDFDVQEIAFDPALSMYFAGKLIEEGLPLVEITQRSLFFTPPLIQVENLVLEKKLAHDGNPVMGWMVSNLVVKESKFNELKSPTKERPENKIDGPIAMLMALGRALAKPSSEKSFWETES